MTDQPTTKSASTETELVPDNQPEDQTSQPLLGCVLPLFRNVDDVLPEDLGKSNPRGRVGAWQLRQGELAAEGRTNVQLLLEENAGLRLEGERDAADLEELQQERENLQRELRRLREDFEHRTYFQNRCSAAADRAHAQLHAISDDEGKVTHGFNRETSEFQATVHTRLGEFTIYLEYRRPNTVIGRLETRAKNGRNIPVFPLDEEGLLPDHEQLLARLLGARNGAMSSRARQKFEPRPKQPAGESVNITVTVLQPGYDEVKSLHPSSGNPPTPNPTEGKLPHRASH